MRIETVTAQKHVEFPYLLEGGRFEEIIRRIHGERMSLSEYQAPFAPLRALGVSAINPCLGKSRFLASSK